MEEREKRLIGEQIEPGGRPKAPGRLELLQRFVNTHNHDFPAGWDRIGTGAKAQSWLRAKKLIGRDEHVTDADAAALRDLREALRALALANHHGDDPDRAALDAIRAAARDAQLTVAVDVSGRTSLEPAGPGVAGAVATLLGILHEAELTGHWLRMKGCRQCGYAFFDRSKNRSAAWCAMSICGNRTKNRAHYRRKREAT
jgi:predicted RNA-binding Zn ribbon-like protein